MYEGSHDQANENSDTSTQEHGNGDQPTHRQVHAAHDRYFEELTEAWNDMMEEFQTLQVDLMRTVQQAMIDQDAATMQKAQFDYQRMCQECAMNTSSRDRFEDAFTHYKEAVVKALANADLNDLGHTDLMLVSQSLAVVAQNALTISMSTAPNPLARNGRKDR